MIKGPFQLKALTINNWPVYIAIIIIIALKDTTFATCMECIMCSDLGQE